MATMDSRPVDNDTTAYTWIPGQPFPPIYMDHPEEMLHPWLLNPHFDEILVIHSLALLLGLLGNATVIVVMVGDRKTRSNTNMFLVSGYFLLAKSWRVAVISAKKHKRQRRKRQFVTAKREKVANAKVLNRNTNLT